MVNPYTYIPLTQGKRALVDCEDLDALLPYHWQAAHDKRGGVWYAQRGLNPGTEPMHRSIMGCSKGDGKHVDHINHDGLDNRKQNLRVGTHRDNHQNRKHRSKYGAGVKRRGKRFIAHAFIEGVNTYMGMYDTPEEAQRERVEWLRRWKNGDRPPKRSKNRDHSSGRFV